MAFTALIFTKLTIPQRHYTDIRNGFRLHCSRSEESWDRNSFIPTDRVWLSLGRFLWKSCLRNNLS